MAGRCSVLLLAAPFARGGTFREACRGKVPRRAHWLLNAVLGTVSVLSWWATSAYGQPAAGSEHPARPNFLLILCDDLGYGDLECYGHPHIKTPNLNRLAQQGLRLTACYAAAPVCSSSRAGLMTGRSPSRVGVYDWIPAGHVVHLPRTEITIATLLHRAGYDTAHCGKWHLNGRFNKPDQPQPNDHGFQYWFSTQNNAAPSHENPTNFVRNGRPVGPLKGYSCQLVADEAIHWLKAVRDRSRPFFLFVCFHEPHEPVASPPELVARYRDVARNEDQAQYFANVTNMDAAVGRLMAALDELKLADSTLVWFTSDNGPETLLRYRGARRSYGSPGPLRGMKLWLYEGGIRVPGIIRWPGHAPENAQTGVPVCGLDVLPTFCELAGIEPPRDRVLDGVSMADLFRKSALRRSKPIFWHYYAALGQPKAAMRYGPWTLLAHRVAPDFKPGRNVDRRSMQVIKQARLGEFELYNLLDDLAQKHDLASEYPDRVREMAAQLVQWHKEIQREGPDWYADTPDASP